MRARLLGFADHCVLMPFGESKLQGEETQLVSLLMLEGGAVVGGWDLEKRNSRKRRDREGGRERR